MVHTMSPTEIQELDRRNRLDYLGLKKEVRELKRAVTGFNGDTGLKGHAERTDLVLVELKQGQADIKKLLIGDETDANDGGGMKGNQRELCKMQKAIVRFFWVIVGVFISGTGSMVFFVIQTNLATP